LHKFQHYASCLFHYSILLSKTDPVACFLEILVTLESKDFHFSNMKFARSVILLAFEIVRLGQT